MKEEGALEPVDFPSICAELTRAGIDHSLVRDGGNITFVRMPAAVPNSTTEWISVVPSDCCDRHWHVVLNNSGEPVVSELYRFTMGDWSPADAVAIVREHLAERWHGG